MISNIGGFENSESHLPLRVFLCYSPGNVPNVVVVDHLQDVVLWKHESNSLHYAKYLKTSKALDGNKKRDLESCNTILLRSIEHVP